MSDPIRILIADDHAFVRQALAHSLDSKDEMQVIGQAPDGAIAVEMSKTSQPDVVLMDYDMPRMNGSEATRQIIEDHPDTVVIGLSMHGNGPVETAMLEAGATAFLTKGGDHQTLLSTIRDVAKSNGQ